MVIIKPTRIYPDTDRDLRKMPKAALASPLSFVPPEYEGMRIRCRCGAAFQMPWDKPIFAEAAPLGFDDGSQFRTEGFGFTCDFCGNENRFELPRNEVQNGYFKFFGDESKRSLNKGNHFLYVYALVCFFADTEQMFRVKLYDVKKQIRPDVPPEDWVFHTNEIRSMELRKRLGIKISIEEINILMKDLSAFIGDNDKKGWFLLLLPLQFLLIHRKTTRNRSETKPWHLRCTQ